MGTPRPTRPARRRLSRIGLTIGLAAGLAVLPMPVRAEQTGEAPGPVAESPAPENPAPENPAPENPAVESPAATESPAAPESPAVPESPEPGPTAAEPEPGPTVTSAPPPRPRPAAIRILPLGDSLTWGVGSTDRTGYRARLHHALTAAGLTVNFVGSQRTGTGPDTDHEGHPGWRIDQIDAHLARWLRTADPDVVLLDAGTNDYVQGRDTAHAPARLARTVDRIHALAPDAHVVLAKLLVIAGDRRAAGVRELNAAVPRIAAARRSYVSVADMSRIPAANTVDGVHPTDTGYRQMAHQWLQALRPVLATGRAWPRTADPFPLPGISTGVARGATKLTVTARLTGRLTAVDLGGVTVRLQYRRAGARAWTGLGTARTDARGVVRFHRGRTAAGQVSTVVVSGRAAGRRSAAVRVP